VLLAGIAIFIFGGIEGQLLQPHIPDLTYALYAFISLAIGLAVSYLMLRSLKNRDLSM
jgi:ABC-type antimicrobial peptide transport system permease subunit